VNAGHAYLAAKIAPLSYCQKIAPLIGCQPTTGI